MISTVIAGVRALGVYVASVVNGMFPPGDSRRFGVSGGVLRASPPQSRGRAGDGSCGRLPPLECRQRREIGTAAFIDELDIFRIEFDPDTATAQAASDGQRRAAAGERIQDDAGNSRDVGVG